VAVSPEGEGALTFARVRQLELDPVVGTFDAAHLREVHRRIFQDLPHHNPGEYRPDAAGHVKERRLESEPRTQYPVVYALRPEVDARLGAVLSELRGGDALKGLSTPDFTAAMTKLYGDLDHLHPFSEGNSRTLRTFTRQLAAETGQSLDWDATNANAVTRDALYKARDIEVLHRTYPGVDAVSLSQQDGDRGLLKARETLQLLDGADRLGEIIRQSAEHGPTANPETRTVPIGEAEAEVTALLPAARRQAATAETTARVAALRNPSLTPAHSVSIARKAALDGEQAPDRLLAALRARGEASVTFNRVPGATALDRVLAYREGMERQMATLDRELQNGRPSDDLGRKAQERAPFGEHPNVERRGPESREQGGQGPGVREGGGRSALLGQALFEAGRGSTVGSLLAAVPAGPAAIPDGAERVVVMNSSRLHETRHGGEWVVQKTDPQGMLPRGVFRLDTASPAKPDDGATYVGSILHVSAKGVYQVHGNGVARHDPSRFERVPSIGTTPKITYANGRATVEGRGPDLPVKGRTI
jgi:fido (protein-threonine AMPylation protein)